MPFLNHWVFIAGISSRITYATNNAEIVNMYFDILEDITERRCSIQTDNLVSIHDYDIVATLPQYYPMA